MPVLYLTEPGTTLRKKDATLVITKNNEELQVIPTAKVEQVVILGNVNITTPVINYLLKEGKDCVFCSSSGRYYGRLISTESKYGFLRRAQFEALNNEEIKLPVVRGIIKGKIYNQRTFLMRYRRKMPDANLDDCIENLEITINKIDKSENTGSLLGLEGYAGSLYYAAFKHILKNKLGFTSRKKRPPPDPVNSLLSFGYTLLANDAQVATRIVGLDPFIGFLHSIEYSKPSMALDITEEFRTVIVDSIVLRLINNNMIKEDDFFKDTESNMCRLKDEAKKKFIASYEERMMAEIIHPVFNIKVNYRRCLELQVRQIARIITSKQENYRPFLIK